MRPAPLTAVGGALLLGLGLAPATAQASGPGPTGVVAYLSTREGIAPLHLASRQPGRLLPGPAYGQLLVWPDGRSGWRLSGTEVRRVSSQALLRNGGPSATTTRAVRVP